MKDIDFDELDKAVNSLMNSSDAPNHHRKSASSTPKRSTNAHPFAARRRSAALKSTSPPQVKSSISASSLHPKTANEAATPAVRRAGRFMDVVDSSAELNPIRQPITPPQRDISRRVVSVPPVMAKPIITNTTPVETVPSFSVPKVVVPAREPYTPEPLGESVNVRRVEKQSITMPDPIELLQNIAVLADEQIIKEDLSNDSDIRPAAAFGESSVSITPDDRESITVNIVPQLQPSPPEPVSVAEVLQENMDIEALEPEAVDEPATPAQLDSESPFLQDTKIEKRPLNANPLAMGGIEPLVSIDELIEQDNQLVQVQEDELMPQGVTDEPPAISDVPELSSELVAIEATGKLNEEYEELVSVPMKSSTDGTQQTDEPIIGPASITQQYASKESTGDTSHAPIYDASQYADPVAHPAKKKSGWLWVLSVLLLLALGSGGAVALYFAGIIP